MAEGKGIEISISNTLSVIYCMILINQEEFLQLKQYSKKLVECQCDYCNSIFLDLGIILLEIF